MTAWDFQPRKLLRRVIPDDVYKHENIPVDFEKLMLGESREIISEVKFMESSKAVKELVLGRSRDILSIMTGGKKSTHIKV